MMDYQEIFIIFLMGLASILALVVTVALSGVLMAWSSKMRRVYLQIDGSPQMLALGNSPIGQYVHAQLQALAPKVDQGNDKAIQDLLEIPLLKDLHKRGVIDDKTLAKGLTQALGLAIDLLDGKEEKG